MSERSETLADDPFGGRHPTSHEQMTGLPWDASYQHGTALYELACPRNTTTSCGEANLYGSKVHTWAEEWGLYVTFPGYPGECVNAHPIFYYDGPPAPLDCR